MMNRTKGVLLAGMLLMAQGMMAQKAIVMPKITDNWYVGILGGVNSRTTHNALIPNVNGSGALRIGRDLTPTFGFMVESTAYFGDLKFGYSHNFVKAMNTDLLATINLNNFFGGYNGRPRRVEARLLGGFGFNHIFGLKEDNNDDLIVKAGMDFGVNIGRKRAFYLFVEPAINYNLDHYTRTQFNVNHSALQLAAGIVYRFGTSNGTHHFKLVEAGTDIRPAVKPTVKEEKIVTAMAETPFPVIRFEDDSNVVPPTEYEKTDAVAEYMHQHPDRRIVIIGQKRQAKAVRDVLFRRHGIQPQQVSIYKYGTEPAVVISVQ